MTQPSLPLDIVPETKVYKVSVKESPVDGKANEAIIRLLAEYFGTRTCDVRIVSGHTSKRKIVEVDV
jgi:uncharacterized protein (TIGR00251 family)